MSLTDLMSGTNQVFWPQIALVIFVSVFVGAIFHGFTKSKKDRDEAAHLPLDDD